MSAATLTVRIAADLNDFSRNLNKMTRDVDRAAKTVAEVGKTMSLAITLPVALAAAALFKMGAENEAVAAKLDRQFGPAAARVNEQLERMMKIVPETGTELQKMAIATDQFAEGLGMTAPKASLLSESMLKMAATMSADKMISFSEALELIQHGLSGQTKGLKQVGVVISEAQIKQEAYRLGLVRTGHELTPLGTALATYSLMVKQVGKHQGEVAAVQMTAARQMQFLKRDLSEFADATSNLVVPALRILVAAGRALVSWISTMPDWLKKATMALALFAAVIGPSITLAAKLAQGIVAITAAIKLLAEGEALAKFLALLANPEVVIAILLIGGAITAAVMAWRHFKKEVEKPVAAPDLGPLADIKALLGGTTDLSTKDPLAELRSSTDQLTSSFERALLVGDLLGESVSALGAKRLEAQRMSVHGIDAPQRLGAAQTMDQIAKLLATNELAHMIGAGAPGGVVGATAQRDARSEQSGQFLRFNLAAQLIGDKLSLMAREMALTVDTFDAPRMAALELAEQFRQTSHEFAVGLEKFASQWSSASAIGTSAAAGLEAGLTGAMAGLGPFALAAMAVSKVLQGFMPVIDKLMGPLVAFGQILAEIAEPLMKPLFQALKLFGIQVAIVGEVIYTVAAGIAHVVGSIIVAIGKLISKIPFLGGIGKDVQNFGNGILDLGKSFAKSAKELDRSRIELQNLDFDNAANGLQDLGAAAKDAAEQLTNIPQAFKINLARFLATEPVNYSPPTSAPAGSAGSGSGPGGSGSGGSGDGGTDGGDGGQLKAASVYLDGRIVGQIVWDRVTTAAKRQFGSSPSRLTDLVVV